MSENNVFDLDNIEVVEFGIGLLPKDSPTFRVISVDNHVRDVLQDMVQATWNDMHKDNQSSYPEYEPSEKYSGTEHVVLPIKEAIDTFIPDLHDSSRLQQDPNSLNYSKDIFCYFARLVDKNSNRLTALRGARYFKGVLKKKLMKWSTDSMRIIEDNVFKLDNDFDLLVHSDMIHIWRPATFAIMVKYNRLIMDKVPSNVEAIKQQMPFINFDSITKYASKRVRAAQLLASISNQRLQDIDEECLVALCEKTDVSLIRTHGEIIVDDRNCLPFLEVLDRRRYEIALIPGSPERFRAPSRREI